MYAPYLLYGVKMKTKNILFVILGSAILAFGMYNIHSVSKVTEGGVLGLILLGEYHLGVSPAVSGFVVNFACYALGFKVLGKNFIFYSIASSVGFSATYFICEQFPRIYPQINAYPLIAAVLGGVFVGIGCGLSVRYGGATGGDDAIAMSLSKLTGIGVQWVYLVTDLSVLALSLTYIPLTRIMYSVVTVVISGQIVGLFQKKKINV